jgi:hypothetical protein
MKRIIMMLTVAALLVAALTITSAGAFAAPKCDGGTTAERTGSPGEFSCTTVTPSDKNDRFSKTQTTTTKGSSEPNEEAGPTTCQGTGSGKCPPGQFR